MKTNRSARTPRFFHNEELQANTDLQLSKKASHHLVTVMRTKENDKIELFNGDGYNYEAIVANTGQRVQGKRAELLIKDRVESNTESLLKLILVQAISRGDRMDTSIRQAVELGVSQIQPIYSRHSIKPLDDQRLAKKMEHWQNIIVSACEQSGRTKIPQLAAPQPISAWLQMNSEQRKTTPADSPAARIDYILSPLAEDTLAAHLSAQTQAPGQCALIIGPESGFDEDEINTAITSRVQSVQFGNRILRTETAGPACIAVIQSIWGDLKQA